VSQRAGHKDAEHADGEHCGPDCASGLHAAVKHQMRQDQRTITPAKESSTNKCQISPMAAAMTRMMVFLISNR
jgi:hypothetical protein